MRDIYLFIYFGGREKHTRKNLCKLSYEKTFFINTRCRRPSHSY